MPNQIENLDGYKQALFSAGDQPVIMHFEKTPTELDQLRIKYPRHRFYSVNVKRAKDIVKHCNLNEDDSPLYKVYKEGSQIETVSEEDGDKLKTTLD